MAALVFRGLRVQPFKVGPDFIDPGLHFQVARRPSRNLDGWMLDEAYNRSTFLKASKGADVAVVEGVMGLFDGYDGKTERGSSAEMAKWLDLPVVLVVDARSMARSAAALVHGFCRFDPELQPVGVIFNRVGSPGHLDCLKEAMSASLPDIPVLGGIPRDDSVSIPERHLGLVTSDELLLDAPWQRRLGGLMEEHLDLDGLLALTARRRSLEAPWEGNPSPAVPRTSIAVARDAAFCFYYPDNLELLRDHGAQIELFSPLAGESLPGRARGVYLGGGYPEVHAGILSEQGEKGFFADLRRAAELGIPVYAECGGLMVLSRFIEALDGRRYPMAGLLPFGTRMLPRRKALGYTEATLRRACLMGPAGSVVRGHEFHYSEIVESEEPRRLETAYEIKGRKGGAARREGYMNGSVLASYVHLHWGSRPRSAAALVDRCAALESGIRE